MRKHLIATAALTLVTALGMSAGVKFSPVPQKTAETKSLHFSPRTTYTPRAFDNGIMTPDTVHYANYSPTQEGVGFLLSPTGKEWVYTLECDGRIIQYNYFGVPEYDYENFILKVYDEKLQLVGHVKGKVTRPSDAIKCQSIVPDPQLTAQFFNLSGNDIEVSVCSNFNPGPGKDGKPRYGAKQFTDVYTIVPGDVTDSETYADPIFHCDGYYTQAIKDESSITENYVMAFAFDSTWDEEDTSKVWFELYQKGSYASMGKPTKIADSSIDKELVMGTGENTTVPFMVKLHNGSIYFATANYEKSFVTEPGGTEQREENNYVINLYKVASNGNQLVNTVKLPCEKPAEGFNWRDYALGNFSGADDITFDFGDGVNPCYIITTVDSDVQENTLAAYTVFDHTGKEIARFGEDSDSFYPMTDIEGTAKQYGFERQTDEGYGVEIIEYPSLKKVGFLPTLFEYEGDAWRRGTPARIPANGGNLYATEVAPASGTTEKVDTYIGYLNPDGTMARIDKLYFGEGTAKAIPFIDALVQDPYLFTTDKEQEYLVWLYTWKGGDRVGTDLQLIVCNSKGETIAKRIPETGHSYEMAYVSNASTEPYIVVTYQTNSGEQQNSKLIYHNEFIRLPLNKFEGEGTAESPYLLKTFGDLDQVRNNLTSHFALANTIDCENRPFRPIEGEFKGSLDGKGFALNNLNLPFDNSGQAFFKELGFNQPETADANIVKVAVKNLTINAPKTSFEGSTLGVKTFGILAHTMYNAEISNVHIISPSFAKELTRINWGTFASQATNTAISDCSVKDADINVPLATGMGGLVYDMRNSTIANSAFSGKLTGRTNIGGLAAVTNGGESSLTDNHVNAEITASSSNAGGLIASNNTRATAFNNVVEGTIACDENAGALFGSLAAFEVETDPVIVENNVAALTAFNAGDTPTCVHRLVGESSIDMGPRYITVDNPDYDPNGPADEETNPTTIQQEVPATNDPTIGTNYVLGELDAFEPAVDGKLLATEGTDKAAAEATQEWYTGLGFKFGNDAANPWVATAAVPALYFEATAAAQLYFANDNLTGKEETTAKATLVLVNVEPGEPSYTFSTDGIAEVADVTLDETDSSKVIVSLNLLEAGKTSLSFTMGGKTAVLYITVEATSGVDNVAADTTALTYANGTLSAAGCQLAVFDAQGRLAAAGFDTLATDNLPAGLYIARANGADGFTATLKFVVK